VSVARLLRPASIAIVGASDKIGPGLNAWLALQRIGYAGRVYLVTPSRPELFGQATYPTLDAIADPIDTVFIAVPQAAVVDAVRAAAVRGVGGAVVLSSGFGEAGPEGVRAQDELASIAQAHGMAVCGPNCLGFLNFAGRAAAWGTTMPDHLGKGHVAAVVQSGSIGIALLNAGRDIGLSHLITSGNEAATVAADYVDYLVDDDDVRVVIGFFEQLRHPLRFLAAARRAASLGKPVIVVKTGRSARGRQAVMAHTGAVAGSDEVCDAAFRAAGVIRVGSLDELVETAALSGGVRQRPRSRGVAVLSPSGGEIALALDIAEAAGLELPPVGAGAPRLTALLPGFAHIGNPLDLTWAGLYDPAIARQCAEILAAEPGVGTLVLLQDAPRGLAAQQAERYTNLVRAVGQGAAAADTPLVVVSNLAVDFHPAFEAAAREAGAPCLRGTAEGLFAVARFARWVTSLPTAAADPYRAARSSVRARAFAEASRLWAARIRGRAPAEHEARALFAAYGVEGPREMLVQGAGEAVEAAREIGYPVVLKAMVGGLVHKTEAGLVRVGLGTDDELRAEAVVMLDRVRATDGVALGLLIQQQVPSIAELFVGGRVDPDFGPVVVVGGGGMFVELVKDVAVRLAPVSEETAREMIGETRAAALLGGWRGRPRGDLDGAARAVASLSEFVADFQDELAEAEINPLAVLERGVTALDCAIVPCETRDSGASPSRASRQ
jgi:acetate---CoA ligase (ADP-forming)